MLQYTMRRLVLGSLTALLVSIIIFVILRIAPGDVVDVILGGEGAFYSQETEELLREQLGLNRPLPSSSPAGGWWLSAITAWKIAS